MPKPFIKINSGKKKYVPLSASKSARHCDTETTEDNIEGCYYGETHNSCSSSSSCSSHDDCVVVIETGKPLRCKTGPTGPTGPCCGSTGSICAITNNPPYTYVSVCDAGTVRAFGNYGFVFDANGYNAIVGPTGNASGFYFNTNKSAFRVGTGATGTWSNDVVGLYSFGTGNNTIASGESSFAEGTSVTDIEAFLNNIVAGKGTADGRSGAVPNLASGIAAHVEGGGNQATGDYSHAEGAGTRATNKAAHSEGLGTIASGIASHAEGDPTIASGDYSHAEGNHTLASGMAAHAEGISFADEMSVLFTEGGVGWGITVGAPGVVSFNVASGLGAHAEGAGTTGSGDFSHVQGVSNIASGAASHAGGVSNVASGVASYVEGISNVAAGDCSHVEGYDNGTTGDCCHVEGRHSTAYGTTSHSEGWFCVAGNDMCHAEGSQTSALGFNSHAEGNGTIASGYSSHAECYITVSSGLGSHAEGYITSAFGDGAHSEGQFTTAHSAASHAEGFNCGSSGSYAHSEGVNSSAFGVASHAEGNSVANGNFSHSEGYQTTAGGHESHAEGHQTTANGFASSACGIASYTDFDGQLARSSGPFTNNFGGSAVIGLGTGQYGMYHIGLESNNTNINQVFASLTNSQLPTMPDKAIWNVYVDIVGYDLSLTNFSSVRYMACFVNNGGTVTQINGATIGSSTTILGTPTFLLGSSTVTLQVSPAVANTRWFATFQVNSVKF